MRALTVSRPVVMPETCPPELSARSAFSTAALVALGEALDAAGLAAFFRNAIERHFGRLDLALGIDSLAGIQRAHHHATTNADQFAEQRQIVDLRSEIARADQRGTAARQLREIAWAAQFLHRRIPFEHRAEGHGIGHHVAIDELQDALRDAPMDRFVEMIRAQLDLNIFAQPVIDHQRAEQRRLGFDIARQFGGVRGFGGHQSDWFGHAP